MKRTLTSLLAAAAMVFAFSAAASAEDDVYQVRSSIDDEGMLYVISNEDAMRILNEINSASSWNDLKLVLDQYADVLVGDSGYQDFTDAEKADVAKLLYGKKFNSLSEFEYDFAATCKAVNQQSSDSGNSVAATVGTGGDYADFDTLMAAVQAGTQTLAAGDTIQLASDIGVASTVTIPGGYDLVLDMNGKTITTTVSQGRTFKILSGAKLTVCGNGTITATSYGTFDVYGELIIKDGTYTAVGYDSGSGGGATLRTRPGSKATVEDGVKIHNEKFGAISSEGELTVGACELTSTSHSGLTDENGDGLWSYCVQSIGNATFTDTTVQGVQGGLYIGGTATINGGTYTAAELTDGSYSGKRAFYGLYISNAASLTINDGTFNAGSYNYCVLNGDNDVGMELGTPIIINGGIFNGKVGSEGNSVYGFIINGGTFSNTTGLSDALADWKTFDENGTVVDMAPNMGTAVQFNDEAAKEKAGHFFNVEKTVGEEKTAVARFTSETENKQLEKTLDISKIDGDGKIAFSILLLNAPSDVVGTIIYK